MKKFLFKLDRKLSYKEIFDLFRETIVEFFKEKLFIHCAALSYYTVLTLVPIIYLSIVSFGKIIGQETMVTIIAKFLKENIGISDVAGIIDFLNDVDFEKGNIVMQLIGIFVILFSSSALFNSLKFSINEFFDIEKKFDSRKKEFLSGLMARLKSIILLTFFGFVVIITYFAQTIVISFGTQILGEIDTLMWFLYVFAQHILVILSNVIIFVLIFKYLHDAIVPWKIALAGSAFTSVLLYVGQLLIKYYLTNYFFARDGGLAGTILVILVWMFYSSHIIFLGAKFTAVYAKKIGKPLQVD
jgi:membrane protein